MVQAVFEQLPEALEQARGRAIASAKRSTNKQSGMIAGHPGMSHVMSPQRSEDLMRTHSGHMSTSGFSMDSMAPSEQSFHENGFAGNGMHDMLSLDMSSRATPDSTSTAASSSRMAFMPHAVATQSAPNPVHKLDTLMFPSDDPFAYPNQPMMELGYQAPKDGTAVTMAQDPNFFFPGTLEEMGNAFVNQPPPYLNQNGRQSMGAMGGMGGMYDGNAMMGIQHAQTAQALAQAQVRQQQARAQAQAHAQARQQQQQQQAAQQAQQQQEQQQQRSRGFGFFHRRVRQDRQQERQIDQMFTEHGMQADFGSFFGSGRGGFQGM